MARRVGRPKRAKQLSMRLDDGERDKLAAIRKGLEVMNFPGLKATTSNAIRYALDAGIVQLRRDAQTIAEMRKGRDELIPAALLEIADMEGGE